MRKPLLFFVNEGFNFERCRARLRADPNAQAAEAYQKACMITKMARIRLKLAGDELLWLAKELYPALCAGITSAVADDIRREDWLAFLCEAFVEPIDFFPAALPPQLPE